MIPHARSVEELVGEQVRRWELRNRERKEQERKRAVVTVSRLPGSGGRPFARLLSERLHLDYFDREIVHHIAEDAHLSEAVVRSLDEQVRSELSQWVMMLERDRFLWPYQYLQHLTKVVGTIARHGNAVIVGRGASFILSQGESLRILVVAPMELRVERVARAEQLDPREARRRILRAESDRVAFVKKHFHADMLDPTNHDLVINTAQLTVAEAVSATVAILKERKLVAG